MKIDTIIINESSRVENLYPFSVMHCGWEVRCGAFRLFEKYRKLFPGARLVYFGREQHLNSFLARFEHDPQEIRKENILIVNSELLPTKEFLKNISEAYDIHLSDETAVSKSAIFMLDAESAGENPEMVPGYPIAVYIPAEELINPDDFDKGFLPKLMTEYYRIFPKLEIKNVKTISYLWDAIKYNAAAIEDDAAFFKKADNLKKYKDHGVQFVDEEQIYMGKNVKIAPGAVLDAEEGPIILADNVKIMPNAVIVGPCSIGENSLIKIGAKIYEDTSFGEWCKVGGEVEATIIQSYSNKQHDGFLGHSYICEWVNLGADTNNSDLKNTYGDISVMLEDREVDTGTMFMGLLCGDHTKSAINTSFTTGTVAGICGILVHDGFLPRSIPSYAWTGRKNSPLYKIDKAVEIAKKVMGRRNRELCPDEEVLMRKEYNKVKDRR